MNETILKKIIIIYFFFLQYHGDILINEFYFYFSFNVV